MKPGDGTRGGGYGANIRGRSGTEDPGVGASVGHACRAAENAVPRGGAKYGWGAWPHTGSRTRSRTSADTRYSTHTRNRCQRRNGDDRAIATCAQDRFSPSTPSTAACGQRTQH